MIDENVDDFLKKNICCKHNKNNFDFLILTINIYINNLKNLTKQTYYLSFYQYLLFRIIIVTTIVSTIKLTWIYLLISKSFFTKSYKKNFQIYFFVYHNKIHQLYVNVNVLHERDFNVIVFYVKNKKIFIKNNIELILFLNKILTSIEIKY